MKAGEKIFNVLRGRGLLNGLPDTVYLKCIYNFTFGRKLDLKAPKTFNEKLQWLKLNDRNPLYTKLVDKYEAKKYVADIIGEEYIIPTIGVWDRFDDIDFNSLPDQFVLKCTHDSGGLVICRDKKEFDIEKAKSKIESSLKNNYYYWGREWPYKNVPPRIIAEKYMSDKSGELIDYKFFSFNGYVDCVMVCIDRHINDPKFYFFDRDWNLKRLNVRGEEAPEGFTLDKPDCMDEMFGIAEKLSENIPFVRVDLYAINGKTYFGEMTFFPDSGFDANLLTKTDEYFGDLIDLKPLMKKKGGNS